MSTGQTFAENKYCSILTLYNKINPDGLNIYVLKINKTQTIQVLAEEWNFGVRSVCALNLTTVYSPAGVKSSMFANPHQYLILSGFWFFAILIWHTFVFKFISWITNEFEHLFKYLLVFLGFHFHKMPIKWQLIFFAQFLLVSCICFLNLRRLCVF